MRGISLGFVVAALAGVSLACGSSSSSNPAPAAPATGFFITIASLAYSPANLHVPPGGTVTVINLDTTLHSVTSEATTGAFTKGSVGGVQFDTGAFTGTTSFTIPANATNGTVIPFFCTVHLAMMIPQNGTITVDTSAQPTGAPVAPAGPTGY